MPSVMEPSIFGTEVRRSGCHVISHEYSFLLLLFERKRRCVYRVSGEGLAACLASSFKKNTGANHPTLGVGRHAAVFNRAATQHSVKPTALRDEAMPENIRLSMPWRLRGHRSIE